MALNHSVQDVFLGGTNQVPGGRSGIIGRVLRAKNCQATHYDAGRGLPRRMVIQQRNGFRKLTTSGHDVVTGASHNVSWADSPQLLSSVGNQLLAIAQSIPRVWDETDWSNYVNERVVTNRLSESVFHTSQRVINVQEHAWKSGVTMSTWVERETPDNTVVKLYAGLKSDDGTWVRAPFLVYDPSVISSTITTYGRVFADTDGDFFWLVYHIQLIDPDLGLVDRFKVETYSLNGELLHSNTAIAKTEDQPYWDATAIQGGGVLVVQPLHTVIEATDGIELTTYEIVSNVIQATSADHSDVHCRGPVAFVTNDFDDNYYIGTVGLGEGDGGMIWGYQFQTPLPSTAFTHEFNFGINVLSSGYPDSLVGFVDIEADPDEPTMWLSFTALPLDASTVGPKYDPQRRYSSVYKCTWADVVTFIRQNDFTCQVSRAFKHDLEYYTINYYQSGSGNLLTSETLNVGFTSGDYMLGPKIQPIKVSNGDYTTGSPQTLISNGPIVNSGSVAAVNIEAGDKVELSSSDGTSPSIIGFPMAPAGTPLLKWTFTHNLLTENIGGKLIVSGSTGVTGANGSWEIIGALESDPSHVLYTKVSNISGGSLTPGTFNHAGTVQINGRTAYVSDDLTNAMNSSVQQLFIGGSFVVSGCSVSADNGTKTTVRLGVETQYLIDGSFYGRPAVWIDTASETSTNSGFNAVISPLNPNRWVFAQDKFDNSYVDSHLVTENDSIPGNNIDLPITGAGVNGIDVSSATAAMAEIWDSTNLPKASIVLPDDKTQYTFFLQDIDPDYSFIGATLIVSSDTVYAANNGAYTIVDIDPDPTHHIVYCIPADGTSDQRTQEFLPDDQSIVIIFQKNVSPEFQPCWLIVPLTGTKPVVGRFEYGIAFHDWITEGSNPSDPFPFVVTTPIQTADGLRFVLPYRAVSFTVGQSIATINGSAVNAATATRESTVGIKQFLLSSKYGQATPCSNQLLLPGPMCAQFTATGFTEHGINFGPEAPFTVSQQESSNVGLTKGSARQYIVVYEVQEENGDRVFSIPSPPLFVKLAGDNTQNTIGGRLIQPLDGNGDSVANHYGVTNRKLVGICIYSTSYQDGVPTTEHHKITLDLNVNGLTPVSDTNDSGFSFPNEFTWNYIDDNIDAAIINNEVLYIDKGFLPRYPSPAQRQGEFWKLRSWVIGYDKAIWMSGEKKEGDSIWFFPAFRVVLPTTDQPVAVAQMDDYLIVGCEKSMWYLPATNFPDATGREGSMPRPVQLPFTNGCTGWMKTIREGVIYSSTNGGVWLISRALENRWFSEFIKDDLNESSEITSIAIDKRQRIHVAVGTQHLFMYDQIVETWFPYDVPEDSATYLSTLGGEIAFLENDGVWVYDTATYADNLNGGLFGVPPDIEIASFNFGNVRGAKLCWAMQLVGTYKGEHHLNAVISYPDDDPDNPTAFPGPDDSPFTPDPTAPYLMEINPLIEEASSFALRIFADFDGIEIPGNSFEIELVSCEVGIDPMGLNQLSNSRRITGG